MRARELEGSDSPDFMQSCCQWRESPRATGGNPEGKWKMIHRAYRDDRPDITGLADDVMYRIPGVAVEFIACRDDLCPDCSMPILDMVDDKSGMVTLKWHDDTCPIAPEEAKRKSRTLDHQR